MLFFIYVFELSIVIFFLLTYIYIAWGITETALNVLTPVLISAKKIKSSLWTQFPLFLKLPLELSTDPSSTLSLFARGRRDRITRVGRSFCGHRRRSRSRGGSFLAKENPPFSLFGCRRNVMVWSCGAREGVREGTSEDPAESWSIHPQKVKRDWVVCPSRELTYLRKIITTLLLVLKVREIRSGAIMIV